MDMRSKVIINILRSAIYGVILTLILFLLLALVMSISEIKETILSPAVQIIKIICIALSAIYSAAHSNSKGWLVGILTGIIYIIVAFAICYLLDYIDFNSKPLYVELIFAAFIGAIAGIIGINLKNN